MGDPISGLDAETKLSHAKTWLIYNCPFFGGFLMTFKYVENNSMPFKTMAVDNCNIFWDRSFVDKTPMNELRGVLLHEAMHVSLSHISRLRSYYTVDKWNIAADYAVNYFVKAVGDNSDKAQNGKPMCSLPDSALYDEKYANMSLEAIYKLLPQDMTGLVDENTFRDGHLPGDPEDADGSDQQVVKRMVKVWESLSSDQKAKSQGTMPSDIREALDTFKEPKIDWRQYVAAEVVDLLNKKDYTFNPCSYNFLDIDPDGFYPRLSGTCNKVICVVADTSGSVSPAWLEQFAGEMAGAIELADRTILMTNDADVHECEDATQFSEVLSMLRMRGGGGTDFRPPFKYLEKEGIIPEVLIFLTDGWGPFPKNDPGYPVIWGAIPGTAAESEYPQWSRSQVVVLKTDRD